MKRKVVEEKKESKRTNVITTGTNKTRTPQT